MTSKIDFAGKCVLVTGACGTVGKELVRQALEAGAKTVSGIDNNESELFFLQNEFRDWDASFYLADLRDRSSVDLRLRGIDVVLHAAALKHVGLCEESPTQAVQTNITGTQNVIEAAVSSDVERVVFTSSDKAVNPTNVMGTTKLMGERLMTAASQNYIDGPVFASTRFGNVIGSRGSVVPLFRRQIEQGGPVTLTDADMTRFVMTLEEAASLVLNSVPLAVGGEIFVTKMRIARIEDLANVMVSALAEPNDVEIVEIGAKPGEKMYEELMNEEEVRRTFEIDDFFAVLPPFLAGGYGAYEYTRGRDNPTHPYHSGRLEPMSRENLATYMRSAGLLGKAL